MSITAQLVPNAVQQFFDANGDPLAGGKLYTYAAGTTTPQPTYQDADSGTTNTNPIILDSQGRCRLWINNLGYKLTLKDSLNVVQWTVDQVFLIPPDFIGTDQILDGAVTTDKVADDAITTPKILDQNVTTAKIADNAVTPAKIPNASITVGKLDPNLDVSDLTKNIEVVLKNRDDFGYRATPQYPWTTPVLLPNGTFNTNPTGAGQSVAWSPNEEFVAVANGAVSPVFTVYQRFGRNFYKLSDPTTLPTGTATGITWSPCGNFVAVSHATTPFVTVYQKSGLTLIKIANPAALPAGGGGVNFSRGGEYLATTQTASPFLNVYQRQAVSIALSAGGTTGVFTASGLGAVVGNVIVRQTNPSTLPPGTATGISWSPDGQYLAILSTVTPFLRVYQVLNGAVTAIASPTLAAAPQGYGVSWSPDGTILAIGLSTTPFVALYSFAGGVFSAIANPASLPTSSVLGVTWSPNGKYLALGTLLTPFIFIYSRSGTTFTAQAAPSSLPAGAAGSVAWSPTGQFLAMAVASSPFIQIYQTSSLIFPTDAVAWVRSQSGD